MNSTSPSAIANVNNFPGPSRKSCTKLVESIRGLSPVIRKGRKLHTQLSKGPIDNWDRGWENRSVCILNEKLHVERRMAAIPNSFSLFLFLTRIR